MRQAEVQCTTIYTVQFLKEAVGQCRFYRYRTLQEQGSHHRHISQRQQQSTDNTEHQCLGHRGKVFSFDSSQSQYREEHNQNNQNGKRGASYDIAGSFLHLCIHFFFAKGTSHQPTAIDMRQNSFQYHNGTVYHNTEVDGSQTHQVGRYTEHPHQDKGKKHS